MSERQNNIDPRYTGTRRTPGSEGAKPGDSNARPKFPTIGRKPFTESDVADQHREEERKWN